MDQKEEREELKKSLRKIRNKVDELVNKQKHLFRKDFQASIPGPWKDDVAPKFDKTIEAVDKVDWEYLEGVGLVGANGQWKRELLDSELKLKQRLGRFLDRSISILQSLSGGIPLAGILVEFLEQLRASIEDPEGTF